MNHPNIAMIHGVEERALVMELVPGPTMADASRRIRSHSTKRCRREASRLTSAIRIYQMARLENRKFTLKHGV